MTDDALRLPEAVELGYALVDHLAARSGLRSLAIKGPVLVQQGLRRPRTSVDVDVLADPAGFAALGGALEDAGWEPLVLRSLGLMPQHSTTYRHEHWPCTADLHHYFPGLLAPADEVFEVLWGRRTTVSLAGRQLDCVDPTAHAGIAALHYLRDRGTGRREADLRELVDLVRASWGPQQVEDLTELAGRIGADRTLVPFLAGMGAQVAPIPTPDGRQEEGWRAWRMRTGVRTTTTVAWLVELRRQQWLRRPSVLLRAFALPSQGSPDWDGLDPTSVRGRLTAYVRRLRRGLSALPTALADLRQLRERS